MPANFLVPLLLGGASAIGGALSNRKQNQQQSSVSKTEIDRTTRPVYDEKLGTVRDFLLNSLLDSFQNVPDLSNNLLRNNLEGINSSFDASGTNLSNNATKRGLGRTSAGFSPQVGNEVARAGAIAQAKNNAPLQQMEIEDRILQRLMGFFSSLPVGQQQIGTDVTNTTGTNVIPGNVAGGAISSGSSLAAYLLGLQGQEKKKPTTPGGN
jgi:hypothetical protein